MDNKHPIIESLAEDLLTRDHLRKYLGVGRNRIPEILERFELHPVEGKFPIRAVWRQILGSSPSTPNRRRCCASICARPAGSPPRSAVAIRRSARNSGSTGSNIRSRRSISEIRTRTRVRSGGSRPKSVPRRWATTSRASRSPRRIARWRHASTSPEPSLIRMVRRPSITLLPEFCTTTLDYPHNDSNNVRSYYCGKTNYFNLRISTTVFSRAKYLGTVMSKAISSRKHSSVHVKYRSGHVA